MGCLTVYALLDWDNSLRIGATLFTWTDFLVRERVLPREVITERENLREQYRQGLLSHDDLSRECCAAYLRAMDGMEEGRYLALIQAYLPEDRGYLAPHTAPLMDWLRRHSITPVVVSGSPHDIISHYFGMFGVARSYDFLTRMKAGRLDGGFLRSGGHDKQAVVNECRERFGEEPLLAVGDSPSDLPMLRAARFPVVVGGDAELRRSFPASPPVSCTREGAQLLSNHLAQVELHLNRKENG